MEEKKDRPEALARDDGRSQRRWTDSSYFVIALIVVPLVIPLALLGWAGWYATRLLDGELVLKDSGCRILETHGATVHRLEGVGERLCTVRARFRFGQDSASGRVLLRRDDGDLEIELSASQVLSKAYDR
ncbi:hypothetical protein MX652_16325 [Thauera aromatica]|jgi:hypothetical protein|uniref:hypothetical protein n=1 Tax=Thauera sp. TaxID=1905334 RepID=UPI001FFDE68B|nr:MULTISPECIES: hypothetical protein [Thauera]MCK2128238.1 hypothetical protein [Thauera aromatica]